MTEKPFVGPGEKPPAYKTALLLVDIQNDYFPGGANALEGSVDAARGAARILEHFRSAGLPVFHVQHVSVRPGATFFLPDTDGVRIHESVFPAAGEVVIQKHSPNAFAKTQLLTQLRIAYVSRLVIAGMMTHMCVDATVRAAFDYGFECVLAGDACATKALAHGERTVTAEDVHAAFLASLGAAFAQVLSTDGVLSLMSATRS